MACKKTFAWKEPATWGPLLARLEGQRCTKKLVIAALLELYDGVIVFHATRTDDVMAFYRNGLMAADHEKLTSRAREIFLSGEFPEIDGSTFNSLTDSISDSDDKLCHVLLDDRPLMEDSGHYLIYGSEHICGIAAALMRHAGGAKDYRQILKRFGRPTMLRLCLPLSLIPGWMMLAFAEVVRGKIRTVRAGKTVPIQDFTFIVKSSIPSECVLGHEYPSVIKDPLLQTLYYSPDGKF